MNTPSRTVVTFIAAAVVAAGSVALMAQTSDELAEAAAKPAPIPKEAKNRPNPVEATEDSVARGELLFASQCTMCHGKDGKGTGDLVERLKLPMPDFTDAEMQKQWTDGALFYVLTEGHGRMPSQGDRFQERTKWDLINFVRSFPGS